MMGAWVRMAVASLMLLMAASARAQVADVDGEEIDAFRQARMRFGTRMQELEADTRAYVATREQEERERLIAGYDARIGQIVASERDQRMLTVGRFEQFLDRYPEAPYASHVRFRLADLYYEVASEEWQAEAEAYFAKMDDPDLTIEELEELGDQPMRDLSPSLDLYQQIIADSLSRSPEDRYERLDGTYVMLGFVYNDANNVQFDEAKARQAFADLVQVMPESDLADRSHLFLGNFAFADNQFDAAIAAYESVYRKGPASKYYMEGLYQLAWARYKLNEFDAALALFTELLDVSDQQRLDSGRDSAFAPDAKRFMAFSFADLGFDLDRSSAVLAREYFDRVGEKPYERDVFVELADVLERYTRPEEAIATYRMLQDDTRWVEAPDNPEHQIELITLYQTSVARDLEQAGAARLEFIDRYSEGAPWWDANRHDPEALEVARNYVEGSLLDVAVEHRIRAQESGVPDDYRAAASKYGEYLDKFPISDDFYRQQWFLADSLKMAGDLEPAMTEFDSLIRASRFHKYGDGARYAAMEVRYQQMLAMEHDPGQTPTDAEVESVVGEGDDALSVFAYTSDRESFLSAADEVVNHAFTINDNPDLPDYQTEVSEKRPSLMYLGGQLAFYHHRFDNARKRFESLIADHPRSIEASYAAGLLVDSYLLEGDLQKVREVTQRFTINPPGPASEIDPERFKGTLEGTTFKLALERAEGGDHQGAAEAFLAFREEFPTSEFDVDALYNAAFYYQQAGKIAESNGLYEQFVDRHPDEKRSKGLLFRIAANYEAAFELGKAEEFYDRILKHPAATQAEKADAQYNRSFLLIGLGRHDSAAKGFEAYERDYQQQDDRESILWLAGEQWEQVGNKPAMNFYRRYLDSYPAENPDHAVEAEYRLYELLKSSGARSRQLRKQNDAILARFDAIAASGAEVGAMGHRYAAAADFPRLEGLFEDYSDEALTGDETGDAALLNEVKPEQLKALEAEIKQYIGRFSNFEYNSGALLLQAKAALYLADLGLSIKCPASLSEEDCWLYEDILQEKVFPQYYEIETVGISRLEQLVSAARDSKRHSRYIDLALTELNRRRPSEFPAAKHEIEGRMDASMPAVRAPRRVEAP